MRRFDFARTLAVYVALGLAVAAALHVFAGTRPGFGARFTQAPQGVPTGRDERFTR
ncbi:MAG: hypothetical protein M3R53_04020 [Candidatus Eremiobacteraeota bacterium]|nr:hypothetical protein [Candidatus Eremiobacteraeota bacterium]